MEIWFALLVPVMLSLLALLLWKHKITWWETLIPIVVCVIVISLMKHFMIKSLTNDTEYLSEYVVKATYYEPWNEYIHRTCTRTVSCGKNCTRTVSYDCSYVQHHRAKWIATTNTGREVSIAKSYWQSLCKLFGNNKFKDMQRNYHSIDGDSWVAIYKGQFDKLVAFDFENTYDNRIQTNETVFYVSDVDTTMSKGLYHYDDVKNLKANACLGCTADENEYLRKINALHGYKNQIHILVLVFKGQKIEIAERQRLLWKGGNKNELVICVDKNNQWAKAFSWSDDKWLETWASKSFATPDTMHNKIYNLQQQIPRWQRKHFEDFSYIEIRLTNTQTIWIYVVTFLVSCGAIAFGIFNDFEQE